MVSKNSPFYDLEKVKDLVRNGKFSVVTQRAAAHLERLGWGSDDLTACIGCLTRQHFRKRMPQCQIGEDIYIDCDDYVIRYDEDARRESRYGLEYYVKFAINDAGDCVLIVSSKLSGSI